MSIFTTLTNFSKVSKVLLSFLIVLILQPGFAFAQDAPFITVWQTDNPGPSEDNQITIPGTGTDYLIEWEEVGNEANNNGSETGTDLHTVTFPSVGTYRVKISGDFTRISFLRVGADKNKILEIEQWGDINWSSFNRAFWGCSNLNQSSTDAPDLSNVTNMSYMFFGASSFNGHIGNWNVANVSDMSFMFDRASAFNGDIGSWNVANVTDMSFMFQSASAFNGDIGSWNVANVTDMQSMFYRASSFNGDIGNWNVANVTNMRSMFSRASSFNGDIGNWNVANVTNMGSMFSSVSVSSFNGDIGNWNVSNVTDMGYMFSNATVFNADISNWNVSNLTNMSSMFSSASSFNGDIGSWDVANVTDMARMFDGASSFNGEIGSWDVANVTDMSYMFFGASSFNGDIGSWDVANVTNMAFMFRDASAFNGDIGSWNVANVNNMESMFDGASSFNGDIGSWDVANVTDMSRMLNASGLNTYNYDLILKGWAGLENLSLNVTLGALTLNYCLSEVSRSHLINEKGWTINRDTKDCQATFISTWKTDNDGSSENNQISIPAIGAEYIVHWEETENIENSGHERANNTHTLTFPQAGIYRIKINGDFNRINFSDLGDKSKILDIENWGDIQWTSMNTAFAGAENLTISATDAPDLSQVTDMTRMFYNAKSLNQDISHWDVSTITNMSDLFHGASSFNQDLSNWDVSNVTKMTRMFANTAAFNQDLNNWNTVNVEEMDFMFWEADAFQGNISDWNTSNVNNMWGTFYGADSMNTDLSNWDVSQVTNMREMFREASAFNQDLIDWNVAKVTDISGMFYEATSFNQPLGDWDLSNASSLFEFLTNSGLSATNYDLSLEGWATNGNIPSDIALSAEGLLYCASAEYRQQLIDDFGWNIMGDETCSLVMEETLPAAEATSVEKDTEIYLTFDQKIEEVDLSRITLKDVNGNPISLTDVYIDSLTLHLVHSGLGSNTYEVLIPESSIISITAKENDAISWLFTTQRILSSEEQQKAIEHSAFPNPFSDFTTIQLSLSQSQSVNLLIFDLKGQMVRQEKYENLGSDKQSIRFERKDLPAGLYNYQIQSADGVVGGKMLIK